MARLKMFDVGNTSRIGFFCLAESKEQAVEIACAAGHVKSAENARCYEFDLDDILKKDSAAESLRELVAEGKPGRLIKELPALTLSRRGFEIAKQSADSGKKIKKENGESRGASKIKRFRAVPPLSANFPLRNGWLFKASSKPSKRAAFSRTSSLKPVACASASSFSEEMFKALPPRSG